MTAVTEPASFRDPASTVFYVGGQVFRGLRGDAAADWAALRATPFFAEAVAAGRLIGTEEVAAHGDWPTVLRHDPVPVISYPFEWTFAQLQDAALLHLDLLIGALRHGLTMKDGYAYNVQWRGAAPVFIDIPSFERGTGGPWAGYRQFCQTFLFPLLLQAHRGAPFRPWLRGQVDGIEPRQIRALFGGRDLLRAGVFRNVYLHRAMEARTEHGGRGARAVGEELRESGFSAELALAAARSLRKLVAGLRWPRGGRAGGSHWASYQETSSYSNDERAAKVAFVDAALAGTAPRLVLDLGCNDGTFSRIAAEHAAYVVAVDGDEPTVDGLYRSLRAAGDRRILPLVLDLTDPSPGIGWRGRERPPFEERVRPDAVLCLALVHHLAITANLPLPAVVDWLRDFGGRVVVEFVHPEDPMAERLLSHKPAGLFPDYRRDAFEALLADRFTVERRAELGTRTLYAAAPR